MSRPGAALDARDRARLLAVLSGTGGVAPATAAALLPRVPGNLRPWLAHRTLETAGDAAPAAVRAAAGTLLRQAALADARRRSELGRLLERLDADGIRAVLLKGPALGALVYPAPHLRTCRDFDVWVRASDTDRARASLARLGLAFPDDEFGGRIDPRAEPRARFGGRGTLIEVHAPPGSLAGLPAGTLDALWQRARPQAIGGLTATILAPADQLLHVALHAARRDVFVAGLVPVVDLALIVERFGASWDWRSLRDAWARDGAELPVVLALRLARRLLGAPVPDIATAAVPGADMDALERFAEAQLWQGLPALLPPGVAAFVAPWPLRRRLRAVAGRVTTYYWRAVPGTRPGAAARIAEAGRRLRYDVAVRLPKLVAAAARGDLRPRVVRDRARVWRDRERLAALLDPAGRPPHADQDAGAADPDAAAHDRIAATVRGAPT